MKLILSCFLAASFAVSSYAQQPTTLPCTAGATVLDASGQIQWTCASGGASWAPLPVSSLVYTQVGLPNGVAGLDSGGHILSSVIPPSVLSAATSGIVTISTLPSASGNTNVVKLISDGTTPTDVSVGGGSYFVPVKSNGTSWVVLSASGTGTVSTGTSGQLPFFAAGGTTVSADAKLDDGATASNTLTYTGSGGITAPKFNGVVLPSNVVDTYTVGTGGVTVNLVVSSDVSAPNQVITPTTSSCGFGIALATVASAGSVKAQVAGLAQVKTDGTIAVGHLVSCSTTTAGFVTDTGQTSSLNVPISTRIIGVVTTASTGANTLATIRIHGPGSYGSSLPTVVYQNNISGVTQTPLASPKIISQLVTFSANASNQSVTVTFNLASGVGFTSSSTYLCNHTWNITGTGASGANTLSNIAGVGFGYNPVSGNTATAYIGPLAAAASVVLTCIGN